MGVLGLNDKQFVELAQGASYRKADGRLFIAPHHGIYFDDSYQAPKKIVISTPPSNDFIELLSKISQEPGFLFTREHSPEPSAVAPDSASLYRRGSMRFPDLQDYQYQVNRLSNEILHNQLLTGQATVRLNVHDSTFEVLNPFEGESENE
jgi:hypothetical protein